MIARARPTRFFIPPLKLSGIFSWCPSISITSSMRATFERRTFGSRSPTSRNGNAMLSSTVIESKSAPLWKSIPTFSRITPSWRSFIPMMFWPWIQISPESGSINPIKCFSKTVLPPPLRPISTSVSPVRISRSTPHKISCCPIFFFNERTAIIGDELPEIRSGFETGLEDGGASIIATPTLNSQPATLNPAASLMASGENDVQPHREEEIYNQNRKRRVHHSFSGGPADADRSLARGQTFVATDEDNQQGENKCLGHSHNDILAPGPVDHGLDVVRSVHAQQVNRDEVSGNDAERNTFRDQ